MINDDYFIRRKNNLFLKNKKKLKKIEIFKMFAKNELFKEDELKKLTHNRRVS